MCGGRWLVLCLAFASRLACPERLPPRAMTARPSGAPIRCFRRQSSSPGDPYGGDKFGLLHLQSYLEDCRGEMFLPTDESP